MDITAATSSCWGPLRKGSAPSAHGSQPNPDLCQRIRAAGKPACVNEVVFCDLLDAYQALESIVVCHWICVRRKTCGMQAHTGHAWPFPAAAGSCSTACQHGLTTAFSIDSDAGGKGPWPLPGTDAMPVMESQHSQGGSASTLEQTQTTHAERHGSATQLSIKSTVLNRPSAAGATQGPAS